MHKHDSFLSDFSGKSANNQFLIHQNSTDNNNFQVNPTLVSSEYVFGFESDTVKIWKTWSKLAEWLKPAEKVNIAETSLK